MKSPQIGLAPPTAQDKGPLEAKKEFSQSTDKLSRRIILEGCCGERAIKAELHQLSSPKQTIDKLLSEACE